MCLLYGSFSLIHNALRGGSGRSSLSDMGCVSKPSELSV